MEKGSDRRRPRAFGQHLLTFQQRQNSARNFFFFHGHHIIHIFLDQLHGTVA